MTITNQEGYQPIPPALDGPPRVEPLQAEELSTELLHLLDQMRQVNIALDSRGKDSLTTVLEDGEDNAAEKVAGLPQIILTMLKHPELFSNQTGVGIQLLGKGCIPIRDRELAILRMGWLCQAPYEWGEHVFIAKNAGISSEEIESVTEGSSASCWNDHERAVLKAVEELHASAFISDPTWEMLADSYNEQQLIELPILIGQYQTVAYYQNSLRLRLHEGNRGLDAR